MLFDVIFDSYQDINVYLDNYVCTHCDRMKESAGLYTYLLLTLLSAI